MSGIEQIAATIFEATIAAVDQQMDDLADLMPNEGDIFLYGDIIAIVQNAGGTSKMFNLVCSLEELSVNSIKLLIAQYTGGLSNIIAASDYDTVVEVNSSILLNWESALRIGIYIFGGTTVISQILSCDKYSPTSDSWNSVADTPVPARYNPGTCTISDLGYIYGGEPVGQNAIADCDQYTPSDDSWSSRQDMPVTKKYHSASAILGLAYSYGSFSNNARCDQYTPGTDVWANKTNMNEGRRSTRAVTLSSKGYVVGGHNSGLSPPHRKTLEEYSPGGDSWATKTVLNITGRQYPIFFAISNRAYCGCGTGPGGEDYYQDISEYDPGGDSWTTKTNAPSRLTAAEGASLSGFGYICGGLKLFIGHVDENSQYDPVGNSWSAKTVLPEARVHVGNVGI